MKLLAFVFATALVGAASSATASYSYKEPFEKDASFSPSGLVVIENVNGDVEIRAWDKNQIHISGEKSAATEEELKQIELTVDVTEAKAVVRAKLPPRTGGWFHFGNSIRANVRFTIDVPAGARIDKASLVNGKLQIEGVRGPIHAHSVNGSINATNVGADTQLNTVNGSISASIAAVASGQRLSFESVNGSVKVQLPADAGFQLNGSTVNGSVHCDLPLADMNGSRHHLKGTVGDGRASLKASTVNGSISVAKL